MGTVRMTMAQALVRFLDQQYYEVDGVREKLVRGMLGIFGHGNATGIGEALENGYSALPFIQAHNEQSMVHTAVGYAKQKNRRQIFACTTSIGPGALNMVTAAATATINRLPVLLLPGDTFADRQPDPVLQQLEKAEDYGITVNDAFKPVSQYWDRIVRPEQLIPALLRAMQVLTDPARTGAVTLCLPQDTQTEAYAYPEEFFEPRTHFLERRPPDVQALERALHLIRQASKPLIIAGGGVLYSDAATALKQLAAQCRIPVVETQAGKGALLWDDPWNFGGVGVTGSRAGNVLARQADVIMAVGTRLTDFTTSSKTGIGINAQVIQLNVDAVDSVKMRAWPLLADAREGLVLLEQKLQGYHSAWGAAALDALQREWHQEVARLYRVGHPDGLSQTEVLGLLDAHLPADAIVVAAAGGLPGDLHRLWRVRSPKGYHMEYGFSCMGYEIAGALGAKLAEPDRPVYALVGDGSYLMLNTALVTAVQQHQKITVVVFNNHGYDCIEGLQRAHGSRGFGNQFRFASGGRTDPTGDSLPLDFAAHARSLGAEAVTATTRAEVQSALDTAREAPGPVVLEISVMSGTGTRSYDAWWRVDTAQISKEARVEEVTRQSKAYDELTRWG